MSQSNNVNELLDFVLVHGAWAGAWALERTAERLRSRGHRVFVPTLSGLGERSHLADKGIDLSTHISDVVNEILWKDLDAFVLVGHSYAGLVITGVAEQLTDRIVSIVYLDAFIPGKGQAFADFAPWLEEVEGALVDAFPTEAGDYLDEADRAWVDGKVTPQPRGTFTEKLRHTDAYQRVPKKTFVQATGWDGPFGDLVKGLRADPGWQVYEIESGHDMAIDKPDRLAEILVERA